MSVANGQDGEASVFNAAFVSKTAASTVTGVVTLTGWTEHSVTDGQSETALSGETVDGAVYKAAYYEYCVKRGTTVLAVGTLALLYVNSVWEIQLGPYLGAGGLAHGVTFDTNVAGAVVTLTAALDVGAGNGTIEVMRKLVPV